MRPTLAVVALVLAAAPVAAQPRPNVVLVVAPDLGARDLGCAGSTFYRTPHLDALAKAGARFTDATAGSVADAPSRAGLLTGTHPARFGIADGRPARPGEMLRAPPGAAELPRGAVTLADRLKAAGYATGHVGHAFLGDRGFDASVAGDLPNDRLFAEAGRFVETNRGRPFFLHVAPPARRDAPAEVVARFPGMPVHGRQSNPATAAVIDRFDAGVGRLVATLGEWKLTANTVVVVTSATGGRATRGEGEAFAPTVNTPFRDGRGFLYEGGLRVPLLVAWPAVAKAGTVVAAPVSGLDLAPTILEAAGLTGPAADGVSLAPLLAGRTLAPRDLFWHDPDYTAEGGRPGGAVRRGPLKFVEFFETGRRELFDLEKDVSESRNLAADRPAVAAGLAAALAAWRKAVGAGMPAPNPDYRPNPPAADGSITLHARTARVLGVMLRYEPLPHKDTLGFWVNAADSAAFDFTAAGPGAFAVEVLQGCGAGSGGAEVELAVGDEKLLFTVKETGGFQAFEARGVGTLRVAAAGRHTLTVRATTKPGPAVMDLRQIVLRPAPR